MISSSGGPAMSRRSFVGLAGAAAGGLAVTGGVAPAVAAASPAQATTPAGRPAGEPARIRAIVSEAVTAKHLRAVITRVTVGGRELITEAVGESMTGVPATPDMHFRNGAVAISYIATLLLRLVDQRRIGLDDRLSRWMPEIPASGEVTLRMLINMTAGYPDYVPDTGFSSRLYDDPFQNITPQDQIAVGLARPRLFAPGTNWGYSHTNIVLLGQALQRLTGRPLAELLDEQVLDPVGLRNTRGAQTAAVPEPVLHAFTSERRAHLGIAAGTRFYEESTFWNPSWTLADGAVQTTDIVDMTTTAEAVGTGSLLSAASHQAQVAHALLGFGKTIPGNSGFPQVGGYNYGLGVVNSGNWILQNPLFSGTAATEAYLPSERIAIAVAVTFAEQAFDADGNYANASDAIFRAIGTLLAPHDPPPAPAAH